MKIVNRLLMAITFLILLVSCSQNGQDRKSIQLNSSWKYMEGDNILWSSTTYDDSDWSSRSSLAGINFNKTGNYFWVRTTVEIPSQITDDRIWLGFKKFNAAVDVYADGIYIGSRGRFPPATSIKIEEETDFLVPQSCIHDNKVNLALRFYLPGQNLTKPEIYFENQAQAFFQMKIKSIFNQNLFIMLAVISLFFIFYAALQYFIDSRDSSYLYFILSVIFITIYFADLGAQNQLIDYNWQRTLCRCCLGIGMSVMLLFLNRFFDRKHYKLILGISIFLSVLLFVLFVIFKGHDSAIENLFLVSLGIVVAAIVYGFTCTIHAIRNGQKDVFPIFLGFLLGTFIAIHDIVYQVIGKIPFMWIQGIAFFILDLGIFITLAIRQLKAKHAFEKMAIETEKQKQTLSNIIYSAQRLANESNIIAQELNDSVDSVVQTTQKTRDRISEINSAIQEQNRIREETDVAVHNLIDFFKNISDEFDNETEIITSTVNQTQEVIKGISQVGEGISTAAEFTNSLSVLTKVSSEDTKQLLKVITQIQSSSNEILGVVTTLDSFTHKIDLLSMNASIEAAHSGAAGKGFAVIAHEIKNLANQVQIWSSKIGEIISSVIDSIETSSQITEKVNTAISKIDDGSAISAEKVQAASEGVRTQEEAGNAISEESQRLFKSATFMQKEVKNQSMFSTQVLKNMETLLNASNSVNFASEAISIESEALNQEAIKLSDLARRTSDSAHDLLTLMT